ncbi:metalloregulator ArsR/SmtB family transcription factor [Phytoactinopolyspora mesophila]|uniref:Metalloregulator ArsR/SmtB family transcription factor n=1 Tax=Phytoactinopolyspora mesophila TaxID=2650750 RepID=A0A7K3LXN7_9ACTN|nr:metalloregulator ArsR/SmtB family transcription factor [Phytoactinopolyspora mesophila]
MHTVDPWVALADPTRRGLLARLAAEPNSVTELAKDLPMSRPGVSQHLKILLDAGLVDVRKHGRQRIYIARPNELAALRAELDSLWSKALSNFKNIAENTTDKEEP